MNLLSDTYIFYADVYFIQNFLIKLAVLYLSLSCNKLHIYVSTVKGLGRLVLAAFAGTVIEIVGLLVGNSYNVFILLVHLIEIPLMMCFLLSKERQQMLKVIITGYFFVMVINGVLEMLWNWFGEAGSYIFFLIIACGITIVGVRIWKRYHKMKKGVFPVELWHLDKCITTYGFYDSGNRLTDPYSKKGVHIISEQLLQQLVSEQDKKVCIPFQALGKADGLIDVYYIENIKIRKGERWIEQQMIPVGVTEDNLFEGKTYEMILNEEVF